MKQAKVTTPRLSTAYYHGGTAGKPRLLLIHGNASSSVFFLPLMERLAENFDMAAPDLRCFGNSDAVSVDATRGMRDFSDDIDEFVSAVGWEKFSVLGWSLGGGVAMQYAIDHPKKVEKLIHEAPLSPYGFGGTYGEDGKKLSPLNLASGAGCANAQLISAITEGDRGFLAQVIDTVYVEPSYTIPSEWKERFIDSILCCKVGDDMFQGNKIDVPQWPFVAAGAKGIANTMAPGYCDLSPLAEISPKPPILWIRGDKDIMVSDASLCDLAQLGKLGAVPGWPGEDICPTQPMVSQTRYVLKNYEANGGTYKECVISGGHGCMLDHEEEFAEEIVAFMNK